jgi:hypothetical protein
MSTAKAEETIGKRISDTQYAGVAIVPESPVNRKYRVEMSGLSTIRPINDNDVSGLTSWLSYFRRP